MPGNAAAYCTEEYKYSTSGPIAEWPLNDHSQGKQRENVVKEQCS